MKKYVKSFLLGFVFTFCACALMSSENVYARKSYTENDMTYRIIDEEATLISCKAEGKTYRRHKIFNTVSKLCNIKLF